MSTTDLNDRPEVAEDAFGLRNLLPFALIRAAHPRQGLLTATGMAVAAGLSGRPTREVALVFLTVLVGQSVLGWHNDIVDRERDRRHEMTGKPIAIGRLDPGTAWFFLACGVLLVIPLAIANSTTSGIAYLLSVAIGMLGNVALRRGLLSWLPWAAAFALYPAFLSYGGWGGADIGSAPQPAMTALAALLGVGVHLFVSLWGFVPDHADGWTYLPLRIGLKIGAGRVLTLATLWVVATLVAMMFVGTYEGLRVD